MLKRKYITDKEAERMQKAVERGAVLLDKKMPEWRPFLRKKLKYATLDMHDCKTCILGHLANHCFSGLELLFPKTKDLSISSVRYGFVIPITFPSKFSALTRGEAYDYLGSLWLSKIKRKPKTTSTRVLV